MLARLLFRRAAVAGLRCHAANNGARPLSSAASSPTKKRVAVIGAGQIGTAVARGILRGGHTVFVHDPSTLNAAALKEAGAVWADSLASAALCPADGRGSVDIVVTAVPAPPHVRAVMEGEGSSPKSPGLLAALPAGTTWIDHTTTDPDEARRLGAAAAKRGIKVLEAPLTGGYALLCAGMMTVLVGGDKELLAKNLPLLRHYAKTVLHVGEIGHASTVKLITNQLAVRVGRRILECSVVLRARAHVCVGRAACVRWSVGGARHEAVRLCARSSLVDAVASCRH